VRRDFVEQQAQHLRALGHRLDVLQVVAMGEDGWLILMDCPCETHEEQQSFCKYRHGTRSRAVQQP
jgi:hypothetical protein